MGRQLEVGWGLGPTPSPVLSPINNYPKDTAFYTYIIQLSHLHWITLKTKNCTNVSGFEQQQEARPHWVFNQYLVTMQCVFDALTYTIWHSWQPTSPHKRSGCTSQRLKFILWVKWLVKGHKCQSASFRGCFFSTQWFYDNQVIHPNIEKDLNLY